MQPTLTRTKLGLALAPWLALGFAPLAEAAPLCAPAPLVQDDEKPDKRPEVKELIASLKAHAKQKGKEDPEAIAVIDLLLQEFPESGPKDRAAIVKALGACFKEKRKENDEGIRDNKLYMAAGVSMGEMGPESVKELISWIGHKSHRKDLALQRVLVLALGKTKHDKAAETLIDLLVHKDAIVQAAAAEGLSNFADAELKLRKEAFEKVMKEVVGAKTRMDLDPEDREARERYDAIAASMITTLQVLSDHNERDPAKWQTWWNKNKKKDWDV